MLHKRKTSRMVHCLVMICVMLCFCGCKKEVQIGTVPSEFSAETTLSVNDAGILLCSVEVEKKVLTLHLSNETMTTFYYEWPEQIEIWIDDAWYPLIQLEEINGVPIVRTDMAYSIESGSTKELAFRLKHYGASYLKSGEYRVILNCCTENIEEDWEIRSIPFRIE